MIYCIDIGHNLQGIDTGAVKGATKEDTLNYEIGVRVISRLLKYNNSVINSLTRARKAKTYAEALELRCDASNEGSADLFVSIHHNIDDGKGHGTEVWYMSENGRQVAEKICREMEKLGFKNRGAKKAGVDGKNLFVLRNTKAVAVLIEVAFIDNDGDMKRWSVERIASAITTALTGKTDIFTYIDPQRAERMTQIRLTQIFCNSMNIKDAEGKPLLIDGILGAKTRYCLQKLLIYLDKMQNTEYTRG